MFRHNRLFYSSVFAIGIILLAATCIDSEALRGRIIITLTDAPVDASNIREVNISIKKIDILPEGSQSWQTLKSFEEPRTVNLLEFTQGEVYDLTEQFLNPGKYKGIRIELNIAKASSGLTIFPQSNVVFTNGTQQTLFVVDQGNGNASNFVEASIDFTIATNQTTFLTLDFDMRKSLVLEGGAYRLQPSIRVVSTPTTGGIDGQFRDFVAFPKVAVYAYRSNTFTSSEIIGEQAFANAVSSALVSNSVGGRFYISFLPADSYDLVFVDLKEDGSNQEVLGVRRNITVSARQDAFACSQTETPQVEGNCLQLEVL
jgi:hypothetical protein